MNDTKLKTLITCVLLCLALLIGGSLASYFIGYRHGAISVQKQIDTIRVHDTLTIEKPQLVKEVYLRIPEKVDTAAILASHFTERIYRDTVKVPDVMTVVLTDTVRENILTGRDFIYDIHLPTFRPASHHAISLGGSVGHDFYTLHAAYRYKRLAVGGGYEFHTKQPYVKLSYDIIQW